MNKPHELLTLSVFDCLITVRLNSSELARVLAVVYGAMLVSDADDSPKLSYVVSLNETNNEISICRNDVVEYFTKDIGEFIFLFEKDMTIELQKIRADLLFIHSAVLEYENQGLLIVAPSGTGKSTTSWAMLNSGFKYLSDELAPFDLNTMRVQPYPHALCLKAEPPVYKLPDECLFTSQTIHVPVKSMLDSIQFNPVKIKYVFYLEFDAGIVEPVITSISLAQASASLYSNSLNILAHDEGDKGLQAAVSVAKAVKNYTLKSNDLNKTCEKIKILMSA